MGKGEGKGEEDGGEEEGKGGEGEGDGEGWLHGSGVGGVEVLLVSGCLVESGGLFPRRGVPGLERDEDSFGFKPVWVGLNRSGGCSSLV